MTETDTLSAYGVLSEPDTVRLERLLPGPIERVWRYLTESDLRRQWLAAGAMELRSGGRVELHWRNDELTPGDPRPAGFDSEHRMESTITEVEPPRLLAFNWSDGSHVTFELEPQGAQVKLTLTHRRLPNRKQLLGVSGGWHAHLDVLAARLGGDTPPPFWTHMMRLRAEYDRRIPQ